MEAKRLKSDRSNGHDRAKSRNKSKVFSPFRSVGVVSNNVPCTVSALGQAFTICTVVGFNFQIYDASNLHLLFVSQPETEAPIDCIASHFHHTFVCYGSTLQVYKRARLEVSHEFPSDGSKVQKIVIFGGFVCVATGSAVHVFKWSGKGTSTLDLYTSISLPKILGSIVDAAHMPTYLNKLVVATTSCLVIVNVKTGSTIHTFNDVPAGILAVEACPVALDVVATINGDQSVSLLNIRTGQTLMNLTIGERVTCISFRSDGMPLLGIGTTSGDVFFYDLDLKRRVHSLRGLHGSKPVTSLEFLAGQPIALTCGADNQLIELAFDPPLSKSVGSGKCRVLRHRGGHSQPPSCLVFADPVGDGEASFVLSGSLDQSLWSFSLRKDSQSNKYSIGKLNEVPPIIDMVYEREKQDRWGTLLTVHKGENKARVWSARRGIITDMELPTGDGILAKSVTISHCGNFGVVGSAKGSLTIYTLQSGLLRKTIAGLHSEAVSGITIDPTNSVIVSTGLDSKIIWTDFKTGKKINELQLDSGITASRFYPSSGLLAVSLDSMCITIVDIKSYKCVRQLWGHGNRVTSFDWSHDGRLLISASLDNTIRTWDVPTGSCVDAVAVDTPVTCLRLSDQGDWMATAHVSGVSVQLWSLRTQFGASPSRQLSEQELENIEKIALPTISGKQASDQANSDGSEDEEEPDSESELEVDVLDWQSPEQLEPRLETLSLQPRAKFSSLVHLEAIRQRNKPVEAPKLPKKQPFFLGLPSENNESEKPANFTEVAGTLPIDTKESKFAELLRQGRLEEMLDTLAELGPAATDLEIRSLETTQPPYTEVANFIDALTISLRKRKNFELAQAWASMLFKAHSDIMNDESLESSLDNWMEAQREEVDRLQTDQRYCLGVLNFLRTI